MLIGLNEIYSCLPIRVCYSSSEVLSSSTVAFVYYVSTSKSFESGKINLHVCAIWNMEDLVLCCLYIHICVHTHNINIYV